MAILVKMKFFTTKGAKIWRLERSCDLEPTKFVILRIFWIKFGDFVKIWNLVKFEILNPKISKFEILNPNTKISNLDTKFLNFDDFCYKFEENFTEIDKIGDISKFEILNPKITKFEILNPKIQNFQFRQNLTKNQNSATVVYHNFAISPKFDGQNFQKFVPIWANNSSQTFFKILKSISKSPKSPKLALITKILKKILKTCIFVRSLSVFWNFVGVNFRWY